MRIHLYSEFVPTELENLRGKARANIPILGEVSDSRGASVPIEDLTGARFSVLTHTLCVGVQLIITVTIRILRRHMAKRTMVARMCTLSEFLVLQS